MNHWSIEISKVDNGYLCETYEDSEVDETTKQLKSVFVVEESDCEHETMTRLLKEVQNYFAVHTSKHNDVNCVIRLEDKDGK